MSRYERIVSDVAAEHGLTTEELTGGGSRRKRSLRYIVARDAAIRGLLATGVLSDVDVANLIGATRWMVWRYRTGQIKTVELARENSKQKEKDA